MKKRIVVLLLLGAMGAGAYYIWRAQNSKNGNRIVVSGNLELTQVDISFKIAGKLIERTVDEGDWVKKGQLIARLDPVQLQQQTLRDKAAIATAKSNYQQLETSIAYQRATLESDVAARRAELSQATAQLEAMLTGSRPQDIQQAQAAVNDARAQLQLAQQDWERAQRL